MKRIVRILGLLAALYLCVCVLAYVFQEKLIYHPASQVRSTPAALNLEYQDLHLVSSQGRKIHAWYVPCKNARGAVVFCHGNAGNLGHRLATVRFLHRFRLSALLFDYQGFGRSEGTPNEANTYQDAEAAWRHLTTTVGIPADRVLVWGRSLGAAVAVELASHHAPAGLVLESAFSSLADVAGRHFFWLPARWLCRNAYDSASKVPGLTCPKLFFHSPQDEIIPFHLGRRLFDAAAEPKRFVQIRGDHNSGFLVSEKDYALAVEGFLAEVLPLATTAQPREK